MTIQIKAIEQYFHVVLFIMLNKVATTFNSAFETQCVTIQIQSSEQLFTILYRVVLTFTSLDV